MNIELLDMTRLTILAKAFIQKNQVVPSLAESSNVSRRLFRFVPQGEGAAFATESWKEWLEELLLLNQYMLKSVLLFPAFCRI